MPETFLPSASWKVDQKIVDHRSGELTIDASVPIQEPTPCPGCGNTAAVGHGVVTHTLRDIPKGGHHVLIRLARSRFRCVVCARTYCNPVPEVAPGGRITRRLAQWVRDQASSGLISNCEIARQSGLSEGTVRRILKQKPA